MFAAISFQCVTAFVGAVSARAGVATPEAMTITTPMPSRTNPARRDGYMAKNLTLIS